MGFGSKIGFETEVVNELDRDLVGTEGDNELGDNDEEYSNESWCLAEEEFDLAEKDDELEVDLVS